MGTVRDVLVELNEKYFPARYPETAGERAKMRRPILYWRLGLGRLAGRVIALLTVTGRSTGLRRRTSSYRTAGQPGGGDPVAPGNGGRASGGVEDDDEVLEVVAELRRFDAPWLRRHLRETGIADVPDDIVADKHRLHLRRLDPTREQGPPALEADLAWLWLVMAAGAALAVGLRVSWSRCLRPPRS